jgi:hypothetical protein
MLKLFPPECPQFATCQRKMALFQVVAVEDRSADMYKIGANVSSK